MYLMQTILVSIAGCGTHDAMMTEAICTVNELSNPLFAV